MSSETILSRNLKKSNREIIDQEFADFEFTPSTFQHCDLRGSVRLANGRFYTDEEWAKLKKRSENLKY